MRLVSRLWGYWEGGDGLSRRVCCLETKENRECSDEGILHTGATKRPEVPVSERKQTLGQHRPVYPRAAKGGDSQEQESKSRGQELIGRRSVTSAAVAD